MRQTPNNPVIILHLFRGKYGKILQKVIYKIYSNSDKDLFCSGEALAVITLYQLGVIELDPAGRYILQALQPQFVEKITSLLNSGDPIQKASGILAIIIIVPYSAHSVDKRLRITPETKKLLQMLGDQLIPILYSDNPRCYFAACWAFARLGEIRGWNPDIKPEVIARLLEIWRCSPLDDIQYVASWAISSLPMMDRETELLPEPNQDLINFIKQQSLPEDEDKGNIRNSRSISRRLASWVIGFYLKTPWTDVELAQTVIPIAKCEKGYGLWPPIESFLKALGEAGKAQQVVREYGHQKKRVD